jgi:hypothetical protein
MRWLKIPTRPTRGPDASPLDPTLLVIVVRASHRDIPLYFFLRASGEVSEVSEAAVSV